MQEDKSIEIGNLRRLQTLLKKTGMNKKCNWSVGQKAIIFSAVLTIESKIKQYETKMVGI